MGEEENKYVSQLKDVYDSCDTTGSGYLDKEELTELCHKLHLERQLPLLLETLLGNNHFARVNFEEFKEGFVTILSSSINLGLSDDESSYLEPVVPDEVKPKYISGAKWYGRRTRPELQGTKLETSKYLQEQQAKVNVKSQLRRSASLESVESLKSDEEPESMKEQQHEMFEGQGRMCTWDDDLYDSPRKVLTSYFDMTENQVRDIWEDLGIGHNGYLNKQELATVCKNIGLKELNKEDLEELFSKLDSDGDGRVSLKEFQLGLFSHSPIPCPVSSTPHKPKHQKSPSHQIFKESVHRSATPSFISGSAALNLFSSIDDGSGFASPEQIASIWAQEGVENCKEILKGLDFNMEERVNLLELSMVLDDEIMASKNGLQQAAFASCKNELHHLEAQMEQISIERDRARAELEKVEKRNVQLFNEVDDNHTALEHHNESKLKNLEQDYKGKLTVMKFEVEMERELLLQQVNHQRTKLEADIKSLKEEESSLREKLTLVIKENGRLQTEVVEVAQKLSASEKQVLKLQKDLDFMLKDKLGLLDPQSIEFFDQEKRFAEIIKEYEVQCRELRDKNDELQLEVEKLHSQLRGRKPNQAWHNMEANHRGGKILSNSVKARIPDNIQRDDQLLGYQHLPTTGQNGVILIETDPYSVSIEMELLVEELKEQHQDLKIQLETKVNYYEREIELMKRNFEIERKDIEQSFKIEISELEEQKSDLEELNVKYQEVIDGLKDQLQKVGSVQELKKRFEKERSEIEQNYAKEISSLGHRLAQERDRLEDDMKMKHETEMHLMRIELHRFSEDNILLKNKLGRLQQEAEDADEANKKHRKHIEEFKMEKEKAMYEIEELKQLISQSQGLEAELEHLSQECRMLQLMKTQLGEALEECQDQLLEANTHLRLVESHHADELQHLRSQMDNLVSKDCLSELENKLVEKQEMIKQLQENLNFQEEQLKWQLATYQEENENSHRLMQEKAGKLEMNLKNAEILLQENMARLKEQFEKNAKSNLLLKDLYVENAQLMKTLQVAEQKQKKAENRNLILEEKISSLNKLIKEITLASQ
ncbi:ninein-like protein isoform X2 [Varanus komodoensis]|uniref:ninein-like protein isoform X2 n=1 Tax=Varanus komodoensis TaxID=61221 RepID=UPI001CF7D25D|nr:ninein-like protein isoform X2 [Varanus komodoensis]